MSGPASKQDGGKLGAESTAISCRAANLLEDIETLLERHPDLEDELQYLSDIALMFQAAATTFQSLVALTKCWMSMGR